MTSKLILDNLAGRTTAGSISVVGEGNGTTTNLQGGLAKVWVQYDMQSTAHIDNSQNVSSLNDDGTGTATLSYSSNLNYGTYCVAATTGRQGASDNCSIRAFDNSVAPSASAIKMYTYTTDSGNAADVLTNGVSIHGDLA